MGLFSGKKKTYVSSSVWNLAGDIKDRPDYLKTLVAGSVLSNSNTHLGDDIPRGYLNGPGVGLRRYANWAKGSSGYNSSVGFVGGGLSFGSSMDNTILQNNIPIGASEVMLLNESDIGIGDSDWWAQQYMVNNRQDLLFSDWFSEFLIDTGKIKITLANGTSFEITPVDFDPYGQYVMALYQTLSGGVLGNITTGPTTEVASAAQFPAVPTGYTLHSDDTVSTSVSLNVRTQTDITYSDNRPPVNTDVNSTTPGTLNVRTVVHHKYALSGLIDSIRYIYVREYHDYVASGSPVITTVNDVIEGGVIRTTKTTVTTEVVNTKYTYRNDIQLVINTNVSPYKIFIYKKGSGNAALDGLFVTPTSAGQYFPYIPIRINNEFLRDINPDIYAKTKQASKKALGGGRLDNVLKTMEENPQLGDIDYTYAVFGVSLNSPDMAAREYLYEFFSRMYNNAPGASTNFDLWEAEWNRAHESMVAYDTWLKNGGKDSTTPPPTVIPYPAPPKISLTVSSTTDWMNFNNEIYMNGIKSLNGTGLRPGHKVGEYWFEVLPDKTFDKLYSYQDGNQPSQSTTYVASIERIALYYQVTDTIWSAWEILGLVHHNYVYGGQWVVTTCKAALADPEESGFIIPIHEQTFKEMSLVASTQLSTACCYLMFNCYQVVKQKWYQTGAFKVLAIVVTIVASVVFAPAGAGAAGVLGSSAAVGTTIGFTGTAALVAGTVANALAAIIIAKALTTVVGDKLGPLLSAVVVIALTANGGVAGNGLGGVNMNQLMSELSKAPNLIALSDGLVKSTAAFMNDKAAKILADTQKMMASNKQDMLEIAQKYQDMFGTGGRGVIDPLMFTNAGYTGPSESRDAYLERTLMTGGDVAALSLALVNEFAATNLNLKLPS